MGRPRKGSPEELHEPGRMGRMNKKRIQIDEAKARLVVNRLRYESQETLPNVASNHLSDETIIGYVLATLTLPEQETALVHIEACETCALKLESAMQRQNEWQTANGQRRLANLRHRLQPGIKEHLKAHFAQRFNRLQTLQLQLEHLIIRPGFLAAPGYLTAATPAKDEGETPDHSLQWYYGPDEDGNLVIRISSFILDYEGTCVSLQAGEWQDEMLLEQVEPGQLGAELVVPAEEMAAYPFEQGIHFSLTV
jgi:hypothetical protein